MRVFTRIIIILIGTLLTSCGASNLSRIASTSKDIGEYYKAIDRFRKANKKEKDREKRTRYAFDIAECYRNLGDYEMAALYYKNAVRRNYPDTVVFLRNADMLRATQKYEEALENYHIYLKKFPDNQQALSGIDAIAQTQKWMANPTRHIVNPEKDLNSRERDFSPAYIGNSETEVIFTSTRKAGTGKRKSMITGQTYADLFKSEFNLQKQKWGIPELIDQYLIVNTKDDEGVVALGGTGGQMLFTRCTYDKTRDKGAQIFSTSQVRGSWAEPVKLGILPDSISVAHPALSPDGSTLYFVSDKPGGMGGNDIWKAEKSGGVYKDPVNLGDKINTPGNEMFPYVRDNGELYFSSDYHIGMGGLDIFKAVKNDNGEWVVENMGYPVNSTGDDFGIAFLPGKNQGLFSSNRKGSKGDDIYSFVVPPIIYQASGEIFNKETKNKLEGATVRIIGTDGTNLRMSAQNGKFQIKLNPETDYVFAAFKDGFLNDKIRATTIGLTNSKDFRFKLFLTPIDAPVKLENINYTFGSFDLLPESIVALDSLVELLNLNPTITIEIMAHTDHIGSDAFNFDLSQKRAQSVVNYLISKNINPKRLVAKGYGETWPKKVTREIAARYDFLKRGDELTEKFIESLATEEQKEAAKALNRRTEFRVLSSDFIETFAPEPQK
jgi:peptidoglycan-associated lipoprotein